MRKQLRFVAVMSQLRAPSGLCFLECGCITTLPWRDTGFQAPWLRLGSGRGQAGLAQGSAQPPASRSHMDTHPVPCLSSARRGAAPTSLSEAAAARAWGLQCVSSNVHQSLCILTSVPTGPRVAPGSQCQGAGSRGGLPSRLAPAPAAHFGIGRRCACARTKRRFHGREGFCPRMPSFQAAHGYPGLLPSTCRHRRWFSSLSASRR